MKLLDLSVLCFNVRCFRNKLMSLFETTSKQGTNNGNNWTHDELELFCQILADSTFRFSLTLESKALNKIMKHRGFRSDTK